MKKLLIILSLAFVSSVHAEYVDGNTLYKSLKSESKIDEALAVGYILGVHDVLVNRMFCTSPKTTYSQLKEAVQQELEIYPNQRNHSADTFIASALKRTWPCSTKGVL